MSAKAILGGLATGVAAYYLVKWIRAKKAAVSGIGDESGVYASLFDVRNRLDNATKLYGDSTAKIEDLDMQIVRANDEYSSAEADRKPTVLFRIAEIQRQRDLAVLEAELVIRNLINPLREKLVTEEARLKSAVIGPDIAMNRVGKIPSF